MEVHTISTDERLHRRYSTSEECSKKEDLHGEVVLAVRREGKGVGMT